MNKPALALLLSTAFTIHSATIEFSLSPPGSDVASGLSPLNEVPPVHNSVGAGTELEGGIFFDTDSSMLFLVLPYGSFAGYGNLTGPATAFHIHGPASVGQNAAVLFDLASLYIPMVAPFDGGLLLGVVYYPPEHVASLLAGQNYINIHTAWNPGGEIRGQLVPAISVNGPPTVMCPAAATFQCGAPAALTVEVGDADGDALVVVWTWNGLTVQTNMIPAGAPKTSASIALAADFPLGANEVAVTVNDSAGNTVSCSTSVAVVDTTPPVISIVSADPGQIGPPNHKMIPVTVDAVVADGCGAALWRIVSVTSNEAVDGRGDGNSALDWEITGNQTVLLRAERSGRGPGRVYTIIVRAIDEAGNLSDPKAVTVTVPH